ncbi:hypothetical protein [Rhizobium sp.]
MLVNIDYEGVLEQAEKLPETTTTLDSIPPGVHAYYTERDGEYHIDKEWRSGLVEEMKKVLEEGRVRTSARNMEEVQKRQRVVAEVKRCLERFVRPEMMRAAVSDFMAQHQFAFRGDKVVVIGKLGESDAELAAVTWATEQQGQPLIQQRAKPDSTFTAAVAKLRLH